eukprot:779997-Rhodomonas_salina.1
MSRAPLSACPLSPRFSIAPRSHRAGSRLSHAASSSRPLPAQARLAPSTMPAYSQRSAQADRQYGGIPSLMRIEGRQWSCSVTKISFKKCDLCEASA